MVTENKYVIQLNDQDDFDLYVNGVLEGSASFVGALLIMIASREGVNLPPSYESESYILAVLHGEGINVDVGEW